MIELVREALQRLHAHQAGPQVTLGAFGLMLATLVVNVLVSSYERRAGRAPQSEVLLADATHTRSDIFTTLTVLVALAGTQLGYPASRSARGHRGHRASSATRPGRSSRAHTAVLGDRIVIAEDDVRSVVMSVPAVMGCHQIRTRGPADYVFLDLHVWMALENAARPGARRLTPGEGSADGAVPADPRRGHPHRTAAP